MDLKNSSIIGYDLLLKGTSDNGEFVLDSGAPEYPFTIGDNFKVNWDGKLTCSEVESLNDDGRNQYSISINENFYVTNSGAVGGGSASFGSGTFGSGSMGGVGFGGGGSIKAGIINCAGLESTGRIGCHQDFICDAKVSCISLYVDGTSWVGETVTGGTASFKECTVGAYNLRTIIKDMLVRITNLEQADYVTASRLYNIVDDHSHSVSTNILTGYGSTTGISWG